MECKERSLSVGDAGEETFRAKYLPVRDEDLLWALQLAQDSFFAGFAAFRRHPAAWIAAGLYIWKGRDRRDVV